MVILLIENLKNNGEFVEELKLLELGVGSGLFG